MGKTEQKQSRHLKQLLKDLKERGISQAAFAKTIGVHPVTVSHWKNGNTSISPESAETISKEFPDYSVQYLLGYSDYKNDEERRKIELEMARDQIGKINEAVFALMRVNGIEPVLCFPGDLKAAASIVEEKGFDGLLEYAGSFESEWSWKIERGEQAVTLTHPQFFAFEKEVEGYVAFRLDQLFERGCW